MKILLSPAKKIDEKDIQITHYTKLELWEESQKLLNLLQSKPKNDIKKLMSLSDNLAELNYNRFQNFQTDFTFKNSKPAIYTFQGDAYQGLDVNSLPGDDIQWLQENLLILSGLYGLVRPLDLIQPYRLEMGTKLINTKGNNLYDFWQDTLTNTLNNKSSEEDFILNLASKEYSKSIDFNKILQPIITVEFKEKRQDGTLKIIGIYAKRARGMMTRFCAINRCKSIKDVASFNEAGYIFREDLSDSETLVFVR